MTSVSPATQDAEPFDLAAYVEQALDTQKRSQGWADMAGQETALTEQTHALKRAIEEDQQQIEHAVAVLGREIATLVDHANTTKESLKKKQTSAVEGLERLKNWEQWVRDNPWKAVGIGFAAGLYFGSLAGS